MRDAFSEALGLTPVVDPRQRPAPRVRPGTAGPSRARAPKYRDAFDEAVTPRPRLQQDPEAQPVQEQKAGINFDAPVEDVRKQIAALPEDQRKPALQEWAKRYVAKERKDGGIVQDATDVVRNLARGTPVGSWLDEANAATASTLHSLGLGGAPYDEAVAYQRARDKAIDASSTKLGSLPVIGDVTAGGVTKLFGGLASAPVAPMVNAVRGSTILPQLANAGATGIAYGALYGSGEGTNASERGANAGIGAAAGGALGIGAPLALNAGRNVISGLKPKVTPKPLRKFHPQARKKVQRALADDVIAPNGNTRQYQAQAGRLGDDGMLADMGPNLAGQADAIANQPGAGKTIVRRALRARDRGSQDRINQATNRALGPDVDGEMLVKSYTTQAQRAASPKYEQFKQIPIPITPKLKGIIDRVQALAPDIENTIASRMKADAVDPNVIKNNGVILNYMKRAMDAVATKAAREGDEGLAKSAGNIAKDLRNEVDKILSPANPKDSIYAQARALSQKGLSFKEGYKDGKKLLDNTVTLGRMRLDNQNRTPEAMTGLKAGAREDIRRRMYTARSAFDTTSQLKAEGTAGRRLLSSQETRGKIRELVGPDAARQLTRKLDAEGQMALTSNNILGNSATAGRQAAQKEFPNSVAVNAGQAANDLGKKTMTGLAMEGAYRIGNALLNGALDERRVAIARDAARMLVARGGNRDQIAQALISVAKKQAKSDQQRAALLDIAQGLIRGAAPAISRESISAFNG